MARAAAGLLLALALAGLLPGCLRWEARVVIGADGRGEATATARFEAPALEALAGRLRAQAAALGLPAAGPRATAGVDPLALPWLRADGRGVDGLVLAAARAPGAGAAGGVQLEARFATLEAAARGGLFHACEVALERRGARRLRFTLRPPWQASGPGSDDALGGLPQASLVPFAEDLAALAYSFTVTFPLAVAATNGVRGEDGCSVTWTLRGRADAVPGEPAEAWLELPPGSEVELLTFRHKPDLARLARRLCVPAPEDTPQELLDPDGAPVPR